MLLEEKILKIDEPKLEDTIGLLPTGKADTMEELFIKFIKPRLPAKNIIKQWHRILMDYTDDLSVLSCCVRFGNNGSERISDWGESGYYKLRRGWLTKNTYDNFEYFFADNAFPAFICKMALDGYAPTDANELRDVFQKHKFPYSFGFMVDTSINEYKGVVIDTGKEPGFLGNYKISHVFDAGEQFLMADGSVLGDSDLSPLYYPIGHSDDFLNSPGKTRKMPISLEVKKVIVAKFLRFAHPLNYFLTPSKKCHTCAAKVYKKDIGEDPVMIHLVKEYLKKEYPVEYQEFLRKIMWTDGYIGIQYKGATKASSKTGTKSTRKTATTKSTTTKKGSTSGKTTPSAGAGKNDNETIVFGILNDMINRGLMTTTMLKDLTDPGFTNRTFGISTFPFLVKAADFVKTGYSNKKFYRASLTITIHGDAYRVCSQWVPDRIAKLKTWHSAL